MKCEAYRVADEMKCGRCGLAWGTDDPDKPACLPKPDTRIVTRVRKGRQPVDRPGVVILRLPLP